MNSKAARSNSPESVTAVLALVGVAIDPSRASSVAETLHAQVSGADRAFAALAFETEPATYLVVAAGETR